MPVTIKPQNQNFGALLLFLNQVKTLQGALLAINSAQFRYVARLCGCVCRLLTNFNVNFRDMPPNSQSWETLQSGCFIASYDIILSFNLSLQSKMELCKNNYLKSVFPFYMKIYI